MTRIMAVDDGSSSIQKMHTYALESAGYVFVIVEDNQKKTCAEENANLEMTFASLYMCRMNPSFSANSPGQSNHYPFKPFDSEKRLGILRSALN